MKEIRNSIDYEKYALQPVIDCISENKEMLSQKENAPLLAKLAYILRTSLWVGKTCFGSFGIVDKDSDFLECSIYEYIRDSIPAFDEDFIEIITDAYTVSSNIYGNYSIETTLKDYLEIVACKKEYSAFEKLMIKPQKTFSDWIDLMSNRFSLNEIKQYVLFGIGNGFMYENGFVEYDRNHPLYGVWQNVELPQNIAESISQILNSNEFMRLVGKTENYNRYQMNERDLEDKIHFDSAEKVLKSVNFKPVTENKPIKLGFINARNFVCQFDKDTHISYIDAAIETYKEIFEENKGGFRSETYIDRHKAQYERLLELRKTIEK